MDIKEHTHPDKLERYSFLWSEARLIIAALALFLGGVPPALLLLPIALTLLLLKVAWIISGLAAGYLLYRWYKNNQMIFGGKGPRDTTAFFVSVVSGINLGLAGLFGRNIGMTISSNPFIFMLVGVLYILAAVHLYRRWKATGEKVF